MIIQSDYLTEGLFGQVFIWMLEILPYIESRGWKPTWRIRTRNYGQPPEFNIFPGVLRTTYDPAPEAEVLSFEQLNFRHKHYFGQDFAGASRYWNSYFRFADDVAQRVDSFWRENFQGETVLGIHYRGTDKNVDNYQTNPVSRYQFLAVVEDFLSAHPEVTAIFVATDDQRFLETLGGFPRARHHQQRRAEGNQPLWNDQRVTDKLAMAKNAIVDALTLSRCRYVLKCMSQLSAFSKVFNPEVVVHRVTACKNSGWFPESSIPPYRSTDRNIRALLKKLQEGDVSAPFHAKALGAPKRAGQIAAKLWQRRGGLAGRAHTALFGK